MAVEEAVEVADEVTREVDEVAEAVVLADEVVREAVLEAVLEAVPEVDPEAVDSVVVLVEEDEVEAVIKKIVKFRMQNDEIDIKIHQIHHICYLLVYPDKQTVPQLHNTVP